MTTTTRKKYNRLVKKQDKSFSKVHTRVMLLFMRGYTRSSIARKLGITTERVRRCLQDVKFALSMSTTEQTLESLRYSFFEMGFRLGRRSATKHNAGKIPSEDEVIQAYNSIYQG